MMSTSLFFVTVSNDTGSISLQTTHRCFAKHTLTVRCFYLAGAERHQEMPAVFYLHVFHVLKEVHVRIMAVGQLDQILEFGICWECLNEAGEQ